MIMIMIMFYSARFFRVYSISDRVKKYLYTVYVLKPLRIESSQLR